MKTRLTFIVVISILTLNISCGQEKLEINKINDSSLIKILNNSELLSETETELFKARIYQLDNGTGSAGFETSEVSHNLLIAISEFDEEPKQSLFESGPFLNPRFMRWNIQKDKLSFIIEHGIFDDRKQLNLRIDINDVTIDE